MNKLASIYGRPPAARNRIIDLIDLVVQTFTDHDAASICQYNPSFSIYLQLSPPHDFAITPRQVEFFKVHRLDPPFDMNLSRQDTLPAEDPSWSYSRTPGQPPPIPPRNEPLLYIPHATASKNLQLVHLPPPMTSKSILDDMKANKKTDFRTDAAETLITSVTKITNPEHDSAERAQVCIIDMIVFYSF